MSKSKKKIPIIRKKTAKPKNKKPVVSEEEFLTVLDNISKRLAYKFKFGYHDFDDMKQQAAIFAIEGLEKYDHSRPLENFLWTHVRNRLFNYKRDNYQRPDKPCLTCPLYDPKYKSSNNQCSKYLQKEDCDLYAQWSKRNNTKKNLMHTTDIDNISPSQAITRELNMEDKELLDYIDKHIDQEYRESYLKLLHGTKVNSIQLKKLKNHIAKILKEKDE
jgi:hypothetical protein